jgi:hypothetical protein
VGNARYRVPLAEIAADGTVTDLRRTEGVVTDLVAYLLARIEEQGTDEEALAELRADLLALGGHVTQINADKVGKDEWVELVPGHAYKRPDGIIEQFGVTGVVNSTAYATVTFPIAFPNAAFLVLGCSVGDSAADAQGNNGGCCAYIIDQSRFTIGHYNTGSNHNAMFWIAFGK